MAVHTANLPKAPAALESENNGVGGVERGGGVGALVRHGHCACRRGRYLLRYLSAIYQPEFPWKNDPEKEPGKRCMWIR